LTRYGINDFGDPIPVDDLQYTYANNGMSNKLLKVAESNYGNAAQGFKDGTNTGDDYMYDAFGNMNKDENKGITNITYNHLNLPKKISFAGNNSITYIYNALGVKLRKDVVEADTQATTNYMGSFQYNNNTLQYIHTAEGYVRHTPRPTGTSYGAFDYVYNYTDHLGNIRLSYTLDPSGEGLKVMDEIDEGDSMNTKTKYFPVNQNHYYPFGLKHTYNLDKRSIGYFENLDGGTLDPTQDTRRTRMVSNNGYQYKYNGKEWQDELGLSLFDYGWRNYDPAIGRWVNIDPLFNDLDTAIDFNQEDDNDDEDDMLEALSRNMAVGGGVFNTNNLNPYAYGYNDPVSYDDPDGRCPVCTLVGAAVGGVVGGGIEIASQLYSNGSVDNWSAVGGSALQGAVTGGVAGLTGGTILLVTAGAAGAANAVGGAANRAIQGQGTTFGDVAMDATVGAAFGAGGKAVGNAVGNFTNNLSNSAKGKLGEAITKVKYGVLYKSQGNDIIKTGTKTAIRKTDAVAKFDHKMVNRITGKSRTVESKFNKSGLTKNQKAAIANGAKVTIDRTTSQGLNNTTTGVVTGTAAGIDAQRNKKP
jgi:RHS repeat-associated protein